MTEGKIMAVDYGLRRIGIAMSDPLQITSSPFDTLTSLSPKQNVEKITEMAVKNNVVAIVIGLPIDSTGTEGAMAKTIRGFADKLKICTTLPVMFIDEAFSSMEATEILSSKGIKFDHKDKGLKDRVSAALILQRYLERKCST
ncbi:MAG: Holliday junction resolvase RuvX [Elusimicrobiota bacterium]|nr:Holliday junction resolvase RuvX [Elusimicrobiota bacterium]